MKHLKPKFDRRCKQETRIGAGSREMEPGEASNPPHRGPEEEGGVSPSLFLKQADQSEDSEPQDPKREALPRNGFTTARQEGERHATLSINNITYSETR